MIKTVTGYARECVFHGQIYENSGKAKHTPGIASQMAFNSKTKSSFNIKTTQNILHNLKRRVSWKIVELISNENAPLEK